MRSQIFLVSFFFWAMLHPQSALALNVLFINPAHVGQENWDKAQQLIVMAAEQFDVKLQLARLDQKKRSNLPAILDALKNERVPLQAVIFMVSPRDDNVHLFSFLEKQRISFITLENTLDARENALLGTPGEVYKFWLAQKSFDDKLAGYLLAQTLITEANKRFPAPIPLIALSGPHIAISDLRNQGLNKALKNNPQIEFKQLIYSNWEQERARKQAVKLILRYPDTRIIWTASDNAGMGAYQALLELGKKPGEDVLLGGVDWRTDIFPLIQQGRYNVSVGGQVLAAVSALAFLYDYYNGVDKQVLRNMPKLKIDVVTSKDKLLLEALQATNWLEINFKFLSIKHNPEAAFMPIGFNYLLQHSR